MPYYNKSELTSKEMIPGLTLRSVWIDKLMITMVDLEPGCVVPKHSHPHEQITYIVKGSMEMTVGDDMRVIGPGEGFTIPPNVEHGAVIGDEPTFVIDSWSPTRDDYKL